MAKRAWGITAILLTAVLITSAAGAILAQGGVTVTPNRDYVNVRLLPAIGATVLGNLGPGDVMTATGQSIDGEWVRIDYHGDEGWVALLVVDVVSGDVSSLPIGDPRTIPYGSNTSPSAGGLTHTLDGMLYARLEDSGLRMRSGPSTAYPIVQNLPRYSEVEVTGRVGSNNWLQVSWQGLLGWVRTDYVVLYKDGGWNFNDIPIIEPATANTGVRVSDANARTRFLVLDDMRRTMELGGATGELVRDQWAAIQAGNWPEVCSAPPVVETYFLNSTDRNEFPDLIEAVARLNQGVNSVNFALQGYLDACNNGTASGQQVAEANTALDQAQLAFADTHHRITTSYTVQVQGLHAHVNYAQDQFERIEAIWLDVRLGVTGEPPCINVPQQPPDYTLTEWEAQTYPEFIPAVERLNEGLEILRQSIALWSEQCQGYTSINGYVMPLEVGAQGYNLMLEARVVLNDVRDNYLIAAYSDDRYLVPAPTGTPDPTIEAILHAPYTPTFTLTPTPSFMYTTSGTVTQSQYHAACTWFGISGEVLDAAGQPRPATLVHIFGPGIDQYVLSGSDPRYGTAGFEVTLRTDAAQLNTWTARIEDGFGNPLSPDQPIVFDQGCAFNEAQITFTQMR